MISNTGKNVSQRNKWAETEIRKTIIITLSFPLSLFKLYIAYILYLKGRELSMVLNTFGQQPPLNMLCYTCGLAAVHGAEDIVTVASTEHVWQLSVVLKRPGQLPMCYNWRHSLFLCLCVWMWIYRFLKCSLFICVFVVCLCVYAHLKLFQILLSLWVPRGLPFISPSLRRSHV